jgi:hypothetical protein
MPPCVGSILVIVAQRKRDGPIMSSSPYVLTLHDVETDREDETAGDVIYRVATRDGDRFDRPVIEQVRSQAEIEWLWPERIALGNVTVIEGPPGAGKTRVALDLASRIGQTLPWPDGAPSILPTADILVISRHDEAGCVGSQLNAAGPGSGMLFSFP